MSDRHCFSRTYTQARDRFVALFESAGWSCRSIPNPQARGPKGETLTLDVGWVGRQDACNVLMSISGTHGLEAFAGAAAQLNFARELLDRKLPEDTAVLFVHGYNSYGWAHSSRANEQNVDLNRNMVPFDAPLPVNPLYERAVHGLFVPQSISADPVAQMREQLQVLAERYGHDALHDGINRGQYSHPSGVYYGGAARQWSSATLLDLLRSELSQSKRVTCIDWHTGMGAYAETFFICFHRRNDPRFRNACRWWGEASLLDESGYNDAPRPSYQGIVINELERALATHGCEFTGVVVEFGTHEPDRVEAAIMIDRALRHGARSIAPQRVSSLRELMLDTFTPDSDQWRDSVAAHSRRIYEAALEGMTQQGSS